MRQNGIALFRAASNGLSLSAHRSQAGFKHTIFRRQSRCFIAHNGSTARLKRPRTLRSSISTISNHPFQAQDSLSSGIPSHAAQASFSRHGPPYQRAERHVMTSPKTLDTDAEENTDSKLRVIRTQSSSEKQSSSSPNDAISRIERSEGGDIKLKMIIPAGSARLNTNLPASYRGTEPLVIDINAIKTDSHTRYVARREMTVMPDSGEQLAAGNEWMTALRRMAMMSPTSDQSWTEWELRGSEWVISELNHLILNMFRERAIPFNRKTSRSIPSKLWVHTDRECMMEIRLQLAHVVREARQKKVLSIREREILGPADKCPLLPETMSKSAFSHYIVKLTGFREPRMANTLGHRRNWIADILNFALFTCPITSPFVSRVAFYQAWKFLVEQQMEPEADELLTRMKALGYEWNVEYSNFRLFACAQSSDPFAFNRELTEMSNGHISPNNGTWAIMLLGASTSHVFERTVEVLKSRFITTASLYALEDADKLIAVSFGHFLSSGRPVKDYLDILNSSFGQNWNTKAANLAMLNCLGERLRMLEAVEYLDLVVASKDTSFSKNEAHSKADIGTACLHHLLVHCNRQTNAELAVWLVIYAAQNLNVRAEQHITFGLLFKVAWKARMYNLLRVVWRYAVVHGEATWEMRSIIYKSLQRRRQPLADTVRGRWTASYGVVCTGCDPLADPALTPDTILEMERMSAGQTTPWRPFTRTIARAVARDRAWSADKVKKSKSTEWMMENATRIRLVGTPVKTSMDHHRSRNKAVRAL